jgi:hypothetical protein
MAVDLQLRVLQSRRDHVEHIQVARAVLGMIAADLRATVQQNTTDFSGLESLAAEALSSGDGSELLDQLDALGATGETGGESGGMSGSSGASGSDGQAAESSYTTDIASTGTVPPVPGLYGNQFELQLDVSRLPRVDEYERMIVAGPLVGLQDIPSDVKTVSYYCVDASSVTSAGVTNRRTGQAESGLVRRVLDRAVTLQASQSGNVQGLAQVAQVLAPEVHSVEFQYFDGSQWFTEWDSCQMQGLPVAVKIAISVMSNTPLETGGRPVPASSAAVPAGSTSVYSLVVQLPTALPAATDSGSTSSSSSSSGGLEAVGL